MSVFMSSPIFHSLFGHFVRLNQCLKTVNVFILAQSESVSLFNLHVLKHGATLVVIVMSVIPALVSSGGPGLCNSRSLCMVDRAALEKL